MCYQGQALRVLQYFFDTHFYFLIESKKYRKNLASANAGLFWCLSGSKGLFRAKTLSNQHYSLVNFFFEKLDFFKTQHYLWNINNKIL